MSPTTAPGNHAAVLPPGAASFPWLPGYPAGIDWQATFEPAPLWHLLDRAVAAHPARICTNFFGKTQSYGQIGALVDRTAAGLQRLGVCKGSKVGLLLPNSPTFIVFYFAILKAGGTVVNYNPLYTLDELAFQIADSQTELMVTVDLKATFDKVDLLLQEGKLARAVVASFPALLPAAKSVLFRLMKSADLARTGQSPASDRIISAEGLLTGQPTLEPVTIDPVQDVAVLQYTGGTTGSPKGAMLTHANVYVNTLQVVAWAAPSLGSTPQRMLGVLPFFHVFAMTVVMNFSIALGAEIVIVPRFVLDDVLQLIDRTRPTCMPGVPTMFTAIVNHARLARFDLSSLQFCLSGGAPLPLAIKRRFEASTGCSLVEGYGLSEASPVVTCNPLSGPVKDGSIGLPLPGTVVSLRSIDDPAIEVACGKQGEVCVKGPQVMKGYWHRPQETADQFAGEYLRTGDVARMDEDGFLFIEDRIKDLIICSGFNVYPRRIEEALYRHPAVAEVTVIGVPDAYRGEVPKAFVRVKAGASATAADLLSHLEGMIAKFELPTEIEFRDELPKTMIGKLSKKELKAEELARRAKAG